MTPSRVARTLVPMVAILAGAIVAGVGAGAEPVELSSLFEPGSVGRTVLFMRLSQVLLAAIVGAALGLSGTALQALVENPLADPFVLGLSGGAAVGATFAIALGAGALGWFGRSFVGLSSFVGAVLATMVVFALGRVRGRLVPERLLLVGVVFNAFASAVILAIQSVAAPGELQSMMSWLLGSIGYTDPSTLVVAAAAVLAATGALVSLSPTLNLLSLGELDAHGLGVDVARARAIVFAVSALLVACAVSLAGVIGFVGLIVPHLVRLSTGGDHRTLVPASALAGAAFLVVSDLGARLFFRVGHTLPPVGMVTALVGAPLFLQLLMRRSRRNAP